MRHPRTWTRRGAPTQVAIVIAMMGLPVLVSCGHRVSVVASDQGANTGADGWTGPRRVFYPQGMQHSIDLLFVIDDSYSMVQWQANLVANFPKLIDALKSERGSIPDLHIGVISTSPGASAAFKGPCGVGGDGGRLQNTPRQSGCKAPTDPWISYVEGKTNVAGCDEKTPQEAVECVKRSFGCIAELGIKGCEFEMPLEAARRALDPEANINPGFLRPEALLVVVFLSNEDDCSVRNMQLFDTEHTGISDPMGPLTNFRCFEFGIECDINDRTKMGPRKDCVPAYDWLYRVEDYIRSFEKLKPSKNRIIMAAIAGPSAPVMVVPDRNGSPETVPSCQTSDGAADPAIRLEAMVRAFNGQVTSVCENNYGPAMQSLGRKIVASLHGQCIESPLLLPNGGVACHDGVGPCKMPGCALGERCDESGGLCIGGDGTWTEKRCGKTCLDAVDCFVAEVTGLGTPAEKPRSVPKCPRQYFLDPSIPPDACAKDCPCWRIVPRPTVCASEFGVSPFGLEIMRAGVAPPGTVVEMRCRSAPYAWSTGEVQRAGRHCAPP